MLRWVPSSNRFIGASPFAGADIDLRSPRQSPSVYYRSPSAAPTERRRAGTSRCRWWLVQRNNRLL